MWLDFRQVRTIFKKFSSAMGMLVVGGEEREGISAEWGRIFLGDSRMENLVLVFSRS
jgi:hypothetical protein